MRKYLQELTGLGQSDESTGGPITQSLLPTQRSEVKFDFSKKSGQSLTDLVDSLRSQTLNFKSPILKLIDDPNKIMVLEIPRIDDLDEKEFEILKQLIEKKPQLQVFYTREIVRNDRTTKTRIELFSPDTTAGAKLAKLKQLDWLKTLLRPENHIGLNLEELPSRRMIGNRNILAALLNENEEKGLEFLLLGWQYGVDMFGDYGISANDLTAHGFENLYKFLKKTSEDKIQFSLSGKINITPTSSEPSMEALRKIAELGVNLSSISLEISQSNAQTLAFIDGLGNSKLSELTIKYTGQESGGLTLEVMKSMLATVRKSNVKTFNFSDYSMEKYSGEDFWNGLAGSSFREVTFRRNKIDDAKASSLLRTISKSCSTLDLRSNNITGEFSWDMLTDSRIFNLDLSKNNLTDEGLKQLAKALRNNKTIYTLNLSGNKFTDEGLKFLYDALLENETLRTLETGPNHSDEELKMMSKLFDYNDTISSFGFKHRTIFDLHWKEEVEPNPLKALIKNKEKERRSILSDGGYVSSERSRNQREIQEIDNRTEFLSDAASKARWIAKKEELINRRPRFVDETAEVAPKPLQEKATTFVAKGETLVVKEETPKSEVVIKAQNKEEEEVPNYEKVPSVKEFTGKVLEFLKAQEVTKKTPDFMKEAIQKIKDNNFLYVDAKSFVGNLLETEAFFKPIQEANPIKEKREPKDWDKIFSAMLEKLSDSKFGVSTATSKAESLPFLLPKVPSGSVNITESKVVKTPVLEQTPN